jgi:hypothetical protein
VHFHVLVVVSTLGEGLTAVGDLAHEGTLTGVYPQMVIEVVGLLEKSSGSIVARDATQVIALPNLDLPLALWVSVSKGSVRA